MHTLPLKGKRAIISGSTQGIGWAAAHKLAELGATCILIARNEAALQARIASLNSISSGHQYLVADFSQPQQVEEAISKYVLENGGAHILVNNTGGPAAGPIIKAKSEDFVAAFQQHLICNHILATSVLPFMEQEHYGRIINVISTSVKAPLKGLGVSNTIRAAVAAWAKTWSNEVAAKGITVNNVLPGATATARLDSIIKNKAAKTGSDAQDVSIEMISEIPAGRFGQAEEIAALIAFLATPDAAYINGTSIPVDGGRTSSF